MPSFTRYSRIVDHGNALIMFVQARSSPPVGRERRTSGPHTTALTPAPRRAADFTFPGATPEDDASDRDCRYGGKGSSPSLGRNDTSRCDQPCAHLCVCYEIRNGTVNSRHFGCLRVQVFQHDRRSKSRRSLKSPDASGIASCYENRTSLGWEQSFAQRC